MAPNKKKWKERHRIGTENGPYFVICATTIIGCETLEEANRRRELAERDGACPHRHHVEDHTKEESAG